MGAAMRNIFAVAVLLATVTACPAPQGPDEPTAATAAPKAVETPPLAPPTEKKHGVTIRNGTNNPVVYTSKPYGLTVEPIIRTLPVGMIDSHPPGLVIDIQFEHSGKSVRYQLDPETAYTFRRYGELLDIYVGSHARTDAPDLAPFKASPMTIVDAMLTLAKVGSKDVLFDLGCGDGRIVIAAAQRFGTRGVGVDIDARMIEMSNINAKKAGVEDLVDFRVEDAMKVDFSSATTLALYLIPDSLALLRPEMERQLKPGTRVISHNYAVPGWEADQTETTPDETGLDHTMYLYQL